MSKNNKNNRNNSALGVAGVDAAVDAMTTPVVAVATPSVVPVATVTPSKVVDPTPWTAIKINGIALPADRTEAIARLLEVKTTQGARDQKKTRRILRNVMGYYISKERTINVVA